MKNSVTDHVPDAARELVISLLNSYSGSIKISRPRKTKLGDFRINRKNNTVTITVNSDLNPFAFLVTLLHELAHFHTWTKYKSTVKPHGTEWKQEFIKLIHPFLYNNTFPAAISSALQKYMKNPKASSCTDVELYKALEEYNFSQNNDCYISELVIGEHFEYESRGEFKLIKKLRKRLLCTHIGTSKRYIFQPISKVKKITMK